MRLWARSVCNHSTPWDGSIRSFNFKQIGRFQSSVCNHSTPWDGSIRSFNFKQLEDLRIGFDEQEELTILTKMISSPFYDSWNRKRKKVAKCQGNHLCEIC